MSRFYLLPMAATSPPHFGPQVPDLTHALVRLVLLHRYFFGGQYFQFE